MTSIPNTRLIQIISNSNPFQFLSGDQDIGQVHRVHLKSAIIPNTEYNVNSKTSGINITCADMVAVGSIPQGQYNITTYLAALKVVLDVASAPNTFIITQDPLTKKLTFVKSAGAQFTFDADMPAGRLLGQSSIKTSTTLSLTCDSIPDLSGLRMVNFKSYTLGKWQISEGDTPSESKKSVIMGGLPMNASFGEMLKYESDESTLNSVYFNGYKNISNFSMRLVDENGLDIDFNNNEWILTFEVHILGAK